ncbi:hypothetical protein [Maribacter sp. 2304DJ31-5]|uniref:hypothetical protein n=1 Tax=Maribacter sp. 2304DJ31-5 TaxID=3386273 RepID=UPI0039BC5937
MLEIFKWLNNEDQPDYRRIKIIPLVVSSVFLSFWMSYVFFWALFEPFGFGDYLFEKICGKNIGKWAILVTLSVFTSITFTMYVLYVYYHRLYKNTKDTNLFYNVYPNRMWLENHLIEFLHQAKKDFFLVSISGNSFTSTPKVEDTVEKKITSADNQCDVKILLHHEDALYVDVRESDEGKNSGHIKRNCKENYTKWLDFYKKHPDKLFAVKRQKEFSIVSFCLQVDDVIYFEPYLTKNGGRHCPLFVIHKNENNKRVFDSLLEQMNELWKTAER